MAGTFRGSPRALIAFTLGIDPDLDGDMLDRFLAAAMRGEPDVLMEAPVDRVTRIQRPSAPRVIDRDVSRDDPRRGR